MDEPEARQAVAEAGRFLLREALVARTWGNVSCRVDEHHFAITPSGMGYENMTADDVVVYNMKDETWRGTRKPSSEKGVHTAAYQQFPEAGFVVHTHQTYASAIGLAGFEALSPTKEESIALGGVALAKYGLPGTKKLRANVADALSTGSHCILMAQHGALIVGTSQSDACARAKLLEVVCQRACKGQPAAFGTSPQPDNGAMPKAEQSTASGTGVVRQSGQELAEGQPATFGTGSADQLQNDPPAETDVLTALARLASSQFEHVRYTEAPPVRETATTVPAFRAQLDDMAQMIGAKLVTVAAEPEVVMKALKKREVVLIKGLGAICRADTEGNCEALMLLTEKACVSYLHTRALGVSKSLSHLDTVLMRLIYKTKYSRKIGG